MSRAEAGRRPLRIGLTGPIGCGKSTVASWLADLGAVAIDADEVAHEVTAPGTPALDAVIHRFGEAFRRPDGGLDRAALGRLVFADPVALADLESIVHPAVRTRILVRMNEAAERGAPVVVEAIKLVESGLGGLCDEIWLVDCPATAQRERLAGRGLAPPDIERRLDAQRALRDRVRPVATRTIDSGGHPAATRARVGAAFEAAMAPHGSSPPAT